MYIDDFVEKHLDLLIDNWIDRNVDKHMTDVQDIYCSLIYSQVYHEQ